MLHVLFCRLNRNVRYCDRYITYLCIIYYANNYVRCRKMLKFITRVSDEIHWGIMIFNGILIKMSRLKGSPPYVCDPTKNNIFSRRRENKLFGICTAAGGI